MEIPIKVDAVHELKGKYIPWKCEQIPEENKYLFAVQCPFCRAKRTVPIDGQELFYWHNDMDNKLTASERESLKTGICDKCWSDVYGEEM